MLTNIYDSSMENTCELKFLLEAVECHKGTEK